MRPTFRRLPLSPPAKPLLIALASAGLSSRNPPDTGSKARRVLFDSVFPSFWSSSVLELRLGELHGDDCRHPDVVARVSLPLRSPLPGGMLIVRRRAEARQVRPNSRVCWMLLANVKTESRAREFHCRHPRRRPPVLALEVEDCLVHRVLRPADVRIKVPDAASYW